MLGQPTTLIEGEATVLATQVLIWSKRSKELNYELSSHQWILGNYRQP
jgi:hypothetical protein